MRSRRTCFEEAKQQDLFWRGIEVIRSSDSTYTLPANTFIRETHMLHNFIKDVTTYFDRHQNQDIEKWSNMMRREYVRNRSRISSSVLSHADINPRNHHEISDIIKSLIRFFKSWYLCTYERVRLTYWNLTLISALIIDETLEKICNYSWYRSYKNDDISIIFVSEKTPGIPITAMLSEPNIIDRNSYLLAASLQGTNNTKSNRHVTVISDLNHLSVTNCQQLLIQFRPCSEIRRLGYIWLS